MRGGVIGVAPQRFAIQRHCFGGAPLLPQTVGKRLRAAAENLAENGEREQVTQSVRSYSGGTKPTPVKWQRLAVALAGFAFDLRTRQLKRFCRCLRVFNTLRGDIWRAFD